MNEIFRMVALGMLLVATSTLSHSQTTSSQQDTATSSSTPSDTNAPSKQVAKPIHLAPVIVTAKAPDTATPDTNTAPTTTSRQQIDYSSGASTYSLSQNQINTIAQGADTKFNQILVRIPGVSDDTYGAAHFREEDPYYRYYINGTLLPSGINGFSQDIDTRFIDSITTSVGALSAYYPEGNYGIIDIKTKSGEALNGGAVSFYGGSFNTLHPSVSYGTSSNGTDFYFNGSYLHNSLGLENVTSSPQAIHDETNQYKGFIYASHQFKDAGRLTLMVSASDADFQIPNAPDQSAFSDFAGTTTPPTKVDSTNLDEYQNEQTYYGLIAYQQTIDDFSFQISQVNRNSTVKFTPDVNGDLFYDGSSAAINDYLLTNGLQGDFTYVVDESHTVRAGFLAETTGAGGHDVSHVYPTDPVTGDPIGNAEIISDNHYIRAYDYALYAQDEWKATDKLTVNFGLRFEQVKAYDNESQISPRINAVYQIDKNTAVHAGYARYFDQPQLLNTPNTSIHQFDNTTGAADQDTNDPVKAERSDYFDAGINHTFLPGLTVGSNIYYKLAKNQLDDGDFGAANIASPYNFGTASIYGAEFSVDYTHDGFSAYGNFAAADSWAKNIVSSQFEFDADELTAINANNVHLDQQQYYTASAGASYTWMDTTAHIDATYEDGIRAGFVNINKLSPYYPVNMGLEHKFKLGRDGDLTVRFDVLNVFDQVYVINDGTGIGEGAVKYGNRRGFFGGVTYSF